MSTLKHLQVFLPSKSLKNWCKVRIKKKGANCIKKTKQQKKKPAARTNLSDELSPLVSSKVILHIRAAAVFSNISRAKWVWPLPSASRLSVCESRWVCGSQTLRPSPRLIYINRPRCRSHGPAELRLRLWVQRHPEAGTGYCSWGGSTQENQLNMIE